MIESWDMPAGSWNMTADTAIGISNIEQSIYVGIVILMILTAGIGIYSIIRDSREERREITRQSRLHSQPPPHTVPSHTTAQHVVATHQHESGEQEENAGEEAVDETPAEEVVDETTDKKSRWESLEI